MLLPLNLRVFFPIAVSLHSNVYVQFSETSDTRACSKGIELVSRLLITFLLLLFLLNLKSLGTLHCFVMLD